MVEYIIKSTISLAVLYLMYFFLLRNIKTFKFNRFYLLFAVIFSFAIPFVHIPTDVNVALSQNIPDYSSALNSINIQGTIVQEDASNPVNFTNILFAIGILISTVLLIRFVVNLYKITRTIIDAKSIQGTLPHIVLSSDKSLPYSFFNFIIVNEGEYTNGKIDDGLILHEKAHCEQYHSIDILFIELIKIVFWFNPLIWLIKKEIQLNHEYLADSKAVNSLDIKDYQRILLNLVFRNHSTYLASNFNYSLTKKRLIMMSKNHSLAKSIARRIVIVPMVLLLALTLTFSQKTSSSDSITNTESEWWYPIIEKHNLEISAYNNFPDFFEMGSSITMDNKVTTITDAVFIIKRNDGYSILKSPLAQHDLDKNTISGDEGVMEMFKYDPEDTNSTNIINYKKFVIEFDNGKETWKAEHMTGQVKLKDQ